MFFSSNSDFSILMKKNPLVKKKPNHNFNDFDIIKLTVTYRWDPSFDRRIMLWAGEKFACYASHFRASWEHLSQDVQPLLGPCSQGNELADL